MEKTIKPMRNDVVCGRDGITITHPGNKYYRFLIRRYKTSYITSSRKHEKFNISRTLVSDIRNRHGRFLKMDKVTGQWYDIGDKKAIVKTSQALRENQPLLREELKEVGAQRMEEKFVELELSDGLQSERDAALEEFKHHYQVLLASNILNPPGLPAGSTELIGTSKSTQGSVHQPLTSNDSSVRYLSNAVTTKRPKRTNENSSSHVNYSINSSPVLSARKEFKRITQTACENNLKPIEKSQMTLKKTNNLSPPKQVTKTKLSAISMSTKQQKMKSSNQMPSNGEIERSCLNTNDTTQLAAEAFHSSAGLDPFPSYINSNVTASVNQRTFKIHFQNRKCDYLRKGAEKIKNDLDLVKVKSDIAGSLDEDTPKNTVTRKAMFCGKRKYSQQCRRKQLVCKFVFPKKMTF